MADASRESKSRSHTPAPTQASSSTKVPRQAKVKDSRQIRTEKDGDDSGTAPVSRVTFREAAKAVGRANKEIMTTMRPIPGAIEVEKFVLSRAFEITSMKSAMKAAAAAATTRAFQSLPRHLRRRAASHNPRRVPKRLREKAAFEIDSKDITVKTQKKRAKAKARFLKKKGLTKTDIYRKRQRDKTWLETHVWHAKRMEMEDLWGYRIARTPNRKSHRPAHRAAHNGCIIHDSSYYATLELSGERDDIVQIVSNCAAGGAWIGSRYETGGRMAELTLHRFREWPGGMIGPAEILWRPLAAAPTVDLKGKRKRKSENIVSSNPASTKRQIWIRVHPSIFNETHTTLVKAITSFYQQKDGPAMASNSSLELRDLRGEFNSFEITGPKAIQVIGSMLDVCRGEIPPKKAFVRHLKYAQSPQNVPERLVVGLQVYDPRLRFPPKNARVVSHQDQGQSDETAYLHFMQPSADLASSTLWDEETRNKLMKPAFSKADLDKRRQALGIPGKPLEARADDNRIPVLLIQRSTESADKTEQSNTAVHGFTLIAPAGWGMPIWQSLVFTGSLIAGLKERRYQHLEAGRPSFPDDYPHTAAGKAYWASRAAKDELRWLRKPASKRLNLIRLQGNDAWKPNWKQLFAAQERGLYNDEEMAVNGNIPRQSDTWLISAWITKADELTRIAEATSPERTLVHILNEYREALQLSPIRLANASSLYRHCLVRGVLTCEEGGSPKDMAYIFHHQDNDGNSNYMDGWIGYVLGGTQSMARGKGHGIGMVTLSGILAKPSQRHELKEGALKVLVGNRQGGPCMTASFKIIP
ncbi:hypothetical protein QFC21_001410 [Naganishia friedmannii]|uniref:Uncharacterized protein n=1 Tax=Naganishia friedmannii TaxID=89922 RepID=A0ACC2W4N3_9TREE|nr:hypothetical protein QFC21_001410 [Naganishia friedmannii]